jgi:methylglutaconyl-CoA hydratase
MEIFQTIQYEKQGAVAHIRLDRPDKHNALNPLMIHELTTAFNAASSATDIRVIVLSGSGKSFCAGADLHYMQEIAHYGMEENIADGLRLATLFDTIYTAPKPVIACVHGSVIGGGNGLAAAADIVIAETETIFAFSEVKLGITPATISPYIIRRCGTTAARELMLTGRKFDAKEAARFQLVNLVVSQEEMPNFLNDYVKHFLTAAPSALADCKQLINDIVVSDQTTTALMPETARRIAVRRASTEGQEGIKAFFEKRKPNWNSERTHENQ